VRLSIGGTVYDPADPIGKMFFNILATFAEFEVDLLRMRTREGMAIARANGKLRGKPPKLSTRQRVHVLSLARTGDHTIAENAELFSVSRATIYREIAQPARTRSDRRRIHPESAMPDMHRVALRHDTAIPSRLRALSHGSLRATRSQSHRTRYCWTFQPRVRRRGHASQRRRAGGYRRRRQHEPRFAGSDREHARVAASAFFEGFPGSDGHSIFIHVTADGGVSIPLGDPAASSANRSGRERERFYARAHDLPHRSVART
jgi:Resolvase, N terminal domain